MNEFSIVRRRPNLLDILIPKQAGIEGYQFQWATNFDAVYTDLFLATVQSGYLDRDKVSGGVDPAKLEQLPGTNRVRAVFNPATFSIPDNKHFWLRMTTVNFAGADVATTPGVLVLTDPENHGTGLIAIAGTAPSGATVANSLVIQLPRGMKDFTVVNSGVNPLHLATIIGGFEQVIPINSTTYMNEGAQALLLVRGSGGSTTFSMSFTNAFPE